MLLPDLPRFGILLGDQARHQAVEPDVSILDLPVEQAKARDQRGDVGACRFGGPLRHRHRRFTDDAHHLRSVEAADAVALQEPSHRRLPDASRLCGRWNEFPELEQPRRTEVGVELEEGRIVPPQLLAHPVGEPDALGPEVFGDARPFAQLDDRRIGRLQRPEAARIRAQGGCHDLRIATVVFRTGEREAVAESAELLGVHGIDVEPALKQRLDHRAVRHLDRDMDLARIGRPALRHQPGDQLAHVQRHPELPPWRHEELTSCRGAGGGHEARGKARRSAVRCAAGCGDANAGRRVGDAGTEGAGLGLEANCGRARLFAEHGSTVAGGWRVRRTSVSCRLRASADAWFLLAY